MFRLAGKISIAEYLQVNQAKTNRHAPEQEDQAEEVESGILAGMGFARHGNLVFVVPKFAVGLGRRTSD